VLSLCATAYAQQPARSQALGPLLNDYLRRGPALVQLEVSELHPLHVLELDIEGAKRPSLFLSEGGSCGNAGCVWAVYRASGINRYRFFGEISFHPIGYGWDANRRVLLTYGRHSCCEGQFQEYRFTTNGFVEGDATATMQQDSSEFKALYSRITAWQKKAPPVWMADGEQLASGTGEWESYSPSGTGERVKTTGVWTRLKQAMLEK